MTPEELKKLEAPLNIMQKFEAIVIPIYENIRLTNAQNYNLKKTRDRLLTRLISGRLSVEDLDIQYPPSMIEKLEEID